MTTTIGFDEEYENDEYQVRFVSGGPSSDHRVYLHHIATPETSTLDVHSHIDISELFELIEEAQDNEFTQLIKDTMVSVYENPVKLAHLGESQWESTKLTAGGPNRRFAGWNDEGYSEAMTRSEASELINHPELNDLGWVECGHHAPALGEGVKTIAGFDNGVSTVLNAAELMLAVQEELTAAIEFVVEPITDNLAIVIGDLQTDLQGQIDDVVTDLATTNTALTGLDTLVSSMATEETVYDTPGSWSTHTFPAGHKSWSVVAVSGAAGGGGGQSAAEGTSRKGGGAGAAGPMVTFSGPIVASTVHVKVGAGGTGGAPGSVGGAGNYSTVSTSASDSSAAAIVWSGFGDSTGGSPGSTTAAAGIGGTAFNGSTRYAANGGFFAKAGVAGTPGGSSISAGNVTPGVFQVTGGGGGAGRSSANGAFKGGDVLASPPAALVAGGTGSGGGNGVDGADGVTYADPFMSTGGGGGGCGLVGGKGGKGGKGSGGGGGGAGVTGGTGGAGGDGFVVITSW